MMGKWISNLLKVTSHPNRATIFKRDCKMSTYAIDTIPSLISKFKDPLTLDDPCVRYACVLFSELAYYYVNSFEIDKDKRCKFVPCIAFQNIIKKRWSIAKLPTFSENDVENYFIIYDRSVVLVGVKHGKYLFISFRGTKFLYDWAINLKFLPLNFELFRMGSGLKIFHQNGMSKVHEGFCNEAIRISLIINHEINKRNINGVEHIVLTGHSLGGAVATITKLFLNTKSNIHVCTFGSPRFANSWFYLNYADELPVNISNHGDIVPLLPPTSLGYADHILCYNTDGNISNKSEPSSKLYKNKKCFLFSAHKIENYRYALEEKVTGNSLHLPLCAYDEILKTSIVKKCCRWLTNRFNYFVSCV